MSCKICSKQTTAIPGALASLKDSHPQLKYLIVGRYDDEEKERLNKIIADHSMTDKVVFAGFVGDEDLAAHFNISDVYIMPSTAEGFGIVFIEALFHGLPVIAGNKDGSVDALAGGVFGVLIDPDDNSEIISAIKEVIGNKSSLEPDAEKLKARFGFKTYKNHLGAAMALNKRQIKLELV